MSPRSTHSRRPSTVRSSSSPGGDRFRYFTDRRGSRLVGRGSTIPKGASAAGCGSAIPNGETASGEVLRSSPRVHRLSYGYRHAGKPIPPGGSRVTGRAHDRRGGTSSRSGTRSRRQDGGARTSPAGGTRWRSYRRSSRTSTHRASPALDRWFAPGTRGRRRTRVALDARSRTTSSSRDAFGALFDGPSSSAPRLVPVFMPG